MNDEWEPSHLHHQQRSAIHWISSIILSLGQQDEVDHSSQTFLLPFQPVSSSTNTFLLTCFSFISGGVSLNMMALFILVMAMFAPSGAFTTPCPSRLGFSLSHSSPCPPELRLGKHHGVSSVQHLRLRAASSPDSDSNQDHDKDAFATFLETQKQRDAICVKQVLSQQRVVNCGK